MIRTVGTGQWSLEEKIEKEYFLCPSGVLIIKFWDTWERFCDESFTARKFNLKIFDCFKENVTGTFFLRHDL